MIPVAIAASLVAVAIAVSRIERLGLESELAIAAVRALVQLSAVAAVVLVIFRHFWFAVPVLAVMLGAASWTSGRRLARVPRGTWLAAASIVVGSAVALMVLFGLHALEFEPRFFIPIAGMLIGNCMTATSLAGARLRDELTDKLLEVEARLALGIPARDCIRPYARRAVAASLIPTIDATKNVGIILLPGAFVGTIIGGASPERAAQIQLIVLFMLLGAVSVAAMTATILVGRAFIAPGERIVLPS